MSRVTAIRHGLLLTVLAVLCLLVAGCESLFLGQDRSRKPIEGMNATPQQLRLIMRALVDPQTGEIRQTANQIILDSDDPNIQYAALHWKATAAPAVREALFAPSGFVALFDTWGLSFQMMDYFTTGAGAKSFGPYAQEAYNCAKSINERMEAIYESVSTTNDTAEARKLIRNWAKQYPIGDEVDARENVYNQATKIGLALGKSFRESVDEMVTTVDDLNRKISVYSDQVPQQARWEAELLIWDIVAYYDLDEMVRHLPELVNTSEQTLDNANVALTEVNGLMQDMPKIIQQERTIILNKLSDERAIVMRDIDEDWQMLMDKVDELNREAANVIHQEHLELQAFIQQEQESIIQEVEEFRINLIWDAFWKILILLACIAAYLTFLVIGVLWFLNKKLWSKKETV